MIKPVNVVNSINQAAKKTSRNINSNFEHANTINRLKALIQEFEECAKSQPNNKALADHINSLKRTLEMYLQK